MRLSDFEAVKFVERAMPPRGSIPADTMQPRNRQPLSAGVIALILAALAILALTFAGCGEMPIQDQLREEWNRPAAIQHEASGH